MKYLSAIGAASALVNGVAGHYIWTELEIDGQNAVGPDGGIRPNTNYNSPVVDLDSPDLRCNEGGLDGSGTSVREISAGSTFTFTSDVAVYHQGPVSVFLSQAPGSVQDYQGDGLWQKIADIGPVFSGGQAQWDMSQTYTFTFPSCIPDGEYLLRIQQLGIHNPWPAGIPQFYIGCAQVSVSGGSGSGWSPDLDIPGVFSESDSGYTANIYSGFTSYEVPGGPVRSC